MHVVRISTGRDVLRAVPCSRSCIVPVVYEVYGYVYDSLLEYCCCCCACYADTAHRPALRGHTAANSTSGVCIRIGVLEASVLYAHTEVYQSYKYV